MDIYNIVFVQIFIYSFLIYYIWPHFPQKKHFIYLANCMNVKQGLKTEKHNVMFFCKWSFFLTFHFQCQIDRSALVAEPLGSKRTSSPHCCLLLKFQECQSVPFFRDCSCWFLACSLHPRLQWQLLRMWKGEGRCGGRPTVRKEC